MPEACASFYRVRIVYITVKSDDYLSTVGYSFFQVMEETDSPCFCFLLDAMSQDTPGFCSGSMSFILLLSAKIKS